MRLQSGSNTGHPLGLDSPEVRKLTPQRRECLLTLAAGAGPLALGLAVYRQGFNLLDDGLWVLGARILAEGGLLYRDLFSIYGPARYLLLLPISWLVGPSALSLAILKALTTGAAAAIGFALSRRLGAGRWGWLVPIGVAALGPFDPRFVAIVALAFLLAYRADRLVHSDAAAGPGTRSALLRGCGLGAVWGAVALFGVDGLAYATVVVAGTLLGPSVIAAVTRRVATAPLPPPAETAGIVVGGITILGGAWLVLLVTGAADAAWWDTVVYPLTGFRAAMGISWWETFRTAPEFGQPFAFASLDTAEILPAAWPGHAAGVTHGIRTLILGLVLIPLLGIRRCLRGAGPAWMAATAVALCGWLTMSSRGDVTHLKQAWLGSLVLLPALLGTWHPSLRHARAAGAAVALVGCALGWGVFLAEGVWLASHSGRPGLVRWAPPGAGVLVSADRQEVIAHLASLVDSLSASPRAPVLIWPAQPGLHVIMGRPPATPQVTLLAGEVRNPAAVIAGLNACPPAVAVIGKARGLVAGRFSIRDLSPSLWDWLRDRYTVVMPLRRGFDEYYILAQAPGGRSAIQLRPLAERLPDVEQRILDDSLPLQGPGHRLGQTVRIGPAGLTGLQIRCAIERGPVELRLRLRIQGRGAGGFSRPLGESTQTVVVSENLEKVSWSFGPVAGTAGQEILWTLEILADPQQAVALGCHAYDPADLRGDTYPEGTAMVDDRPVAADLYFITY